jgi:hypothetical protein
VKRTPVVLVSVLLISFCFFLSCTKIDTTSLGSNLIPPVDNIHTFEMVLDVATDNQLMNDSTRVLSTDDLPVGYINDPDFGPTQANLYFDMSIPLAGSYPYGSQDSLAADSVVLQMAYKGNYGDSNSMQTLHVFEISQTSGFRTDSLYRLDVPDFATTGAELGNKTVVVNTLNDTSTLVFKKDTTTLINVLRIRLDTNFARRLMNYDTTNTANGGYHSDSLFKTLFRGFAIKGDVSGNALTYFNPNDTSTKLLVYYHHGTKDTSFTIYDHSYAGVTNSTGVADAFKRTPGGGWNAALNNPDTNASLLYIPSTPGSYGSVKVGQLDTMQNKVIHLAELIFPQVPTASDNIYFPQAQLFLDMVNKTNDTVFTIQNDFIISSLGYNFAQFGGILKSYNGIPEYHFNISRHVQGIITRHEPNFLMRVYAPFETNIWYLPPGNLFVRKPTVSNIPIVPQIGRGRVVIGGGANTNPANKARLRIVYSLP